MKKLILPLFILIGFGSFGQSQNCQIIGFADTDYILQVLPEFNKAQNELQIDINQYEKQFEAKVAEYENKLRMYQQGASAMIDIVRLDKENELRRIQESIEKFQGDVQVAIRKRENELIQPILSKVGRAIDAVAQENGFDLILNSKVGATRVVQFADKKFDVSLLVLDKLGVDKD
ncbi:MAG TPA: OmpH family outer membrane protein [Cyclobacteriaceae bacterium]|nr:OmpH family outer membrane protein [Cyclobacteriaceae bacterium]